MNVKACTTLHICACINERILLHLHLHLPLPIDVVKNSSSFWLDIFSILLFRYYFIFLYATLLVADCICFRILWSYTWNKLYSHALIVLCVCLCLVFGFVCVCMYACVYVQCAYLPHILKTSIQLYSFAKSYEMTTKNITISHAIRRIFNHKFVVIKNVPIHK